MKIITTVSRKGGVGKTTTLTALAMVAAERELKTMLVDTDTSEPLADFASVAQENGYWSENLSTESIFDGAADDLPNRLSSFAEDGHDLVLVDTKGGEGDFAGIIAQVSSLMIIPTALTKLDVTGASVTIEWFRELSTHGLDIAPITTLLTKVPSTSGMSKANQQWLEIAEENFDLMQVRVPASKVIENQLSFGLFHKIIEDFLATDDVTYKFQSTHYSKIMVLYRALFDEAMRLAR